MKKAILIEGLASYGRGHLRELYTGPLEDMGYEVISIPWDHEGGLEADLVIGYSFGGGKAIRDLVKCKVLITLDAREWKIWRSRKYERPKGVYLFNHFNFYQSFLLRGWEVEGAQNFKVKAFHWTIYKKTFWRIMAIVQQMEKNA